MNERDHTDTESNQRQQTQVRGIIFDKDGTLFNFRKTWLPILLNAAKHTAADNGDLATDLLKAAGYDPENDRFDASGPIAAGNAEDMADAWREVLLRYGWSDAGTPSAASGTSSAISGTSSAAAGNAPVIPTRTELIREMDRASRETGVTKSVPVTDLRTLFSRLRAAGLTLGLATSDSEEAAHASLSREGITEFFTVVTGYDSAGPAKKPSPEVVYNFCRQTGLEAGEVLVVGDTWHDIEMAKAAGARSVAVLTGAIEREALEPYADVVLSSIAKLPEFLGLGQE